MRVCVCVCVFIKLHITAQSGLVILVILCHSRCVCVVISFILDVRFVGVPAGVTQKEGHTRFLYLPSAVLALNFLARRIQPFFSLVDREVEFCVVLVTIQSFSTCWAFFYFLVRKNPGSCDCTEIRTHVPTSEGFEVTPEPPGRPLQYLHYYY